MFDSLGNVFGSLLLLLGYPAEAGNNAHTDQVVTPPMGHDVAAPGFTGEEFLQLERDDPLGATVALLMNLTLQKLLSLFPHIACEAGPIIVLLRVLDEGGGGHVGLVKLLRTSYMEALGDTIL